MRRTPPEETDPRYLAQLEKELEQRQRKGLPTRSESFKEVLLILARAHAAAARKEEAAEWERKRLLPQPTGYSDFQAAADRLAAVDEFLQEFDRQCAAEEAALERHFALRRKAIRIKQRAQEILRQTEYLAPRKKR